MSAFKRFMTLSILLMVLTGNVFAEEILDTPCGSTLDGESRINTKEDYPEPAPQDENEKPNSSVTNQ